MRKRETDQPIRVLVVEDSPAQRELLVSLLQGAGIFIVVGTASDGQAAVEETLRLRPDIVAMDIHLPIFDGYEATRQIMQYCPTPIVMMSSSIGNADLRSLEAQTVGALAVLHKPGSPRSSAFASDRDALLRTLRLMADVPVVTRHPVRQPAATRTTPLPDRAPLQVVAIAASTGGPAAVQLILQGLGPTFPLPILLVQHIARGFVEALAQWLSTTTPLVVQVGQAGDPLQPGHVYLPPDNQHLVVREPGFFHLRALTPTDRYCPSADHLFASVARVYGSQAVGIILTGMGNDGAEGLRLLRDRGGPTLAQDEASCVVYGMPQAAVAAQAVGRTEPLASMATALLHLVGPAADASPWSRSP